MFEHINEHLVSEVAMLRDYRRFADASGSDHVAYLVSMICEDEKRHHQVMTDWVNSLRARAELRDVPGSVPEARRERHSRELIEQTEQLLAREEADLRDLARMRRDLKVEKDQSLHPLLVELFELDTQKHIKILTFIREHARQTAKIYGDS
jgi:rubrerythrin